VKPVRPPLHVGARLVTFGVTQAELYYALPASVDAQGTVMTEWEPSAEDLAALMRGGRVRLWLLYTQVKDNKPMTPLHLEIAE
jgi:hypothetical protein